MFASGIHRNSRPVVDRRIVGWEKIEHVGTVEEATEHH